MPQYWLSFPEIFLKSYLTYFPLFYQQIARVSGAVVSSLFLLAFSFLIIASPILYDMFHAMHLHTALNYLCSLVVFALASSRDFCADREKNIFASSFLQFFFSTTGCFVCGEAFTFFR